MVCVFQLRLQWTPLGLAIDRDHVAIVQMLLAHGARVDVPFVCEC